MYKIYVKHYCELTAQIMDSFTDQRNADQYLQQAAHIARGYNKRVGFINKAMIVFGDDDIFETRMWIVKE